MRIKFAVTVASDDGSVARSADSELLLATDIDGIDPSTAKQYFIAQAEGLVRTIADSQLPALYQSVVDAVSENGETEPAKPHDQTSKREKRTAKGRSRENAVPDAESPVKCTECGATIAHDDAHFVSVVEDGEYQRDAVLCDACYQREVGGQTQSGPGGEAAGMEVRQ